MKKKISKKTSNKSGTKKEKKVSSVAAESEGIHTIVIAKLREARDRGLRQEISFSLVIFIILAVGAYIIFLINMDSSLYEKEYVIAGHQKSILRTRRARRSQRLELIRLILAIL